MRRIVTGIALPAVVLALAVVSAAAQSLPRLPAEIKLARGADSPGQVVFDHSTHVDSAKPNCTSCHSREFNIVKATGRKPIKHENFDKGRQCGSCHGKTAFKFEDDCTNCHRGS